MCHRAPGREWFPNVWDIPGGHIEPHESEAEALTRELREELGIIVSVVGEPFAVIESEPLSLSMAVYRLDSWQGTPTNLVPEEHDRVAWVTVTDAASLPLADDSYPQLFARAVSATSQER